MDCPLCPEIGAGCGHSPPISHVDLVIILLTKISADTQKYTQHMGREHASREKKLPMVNFLIFVQKNVSTIRFQEIKIRPFGDFEKMRFLCFYIIKSMARKGYFGPKSDFRGSKIPPRVASST